MPNEDSSNLMQWVIGWLAVFAYVGLVVGESLSAPSIVPSVLQYMFVAIIFLLLMGGDIINPYEWHPALRSSDSTAKPSDPVERAQQRYVNGEIDDLELEQELEQALEE